jgi:hypothetical protein
MAPTPLHRPRRRPRLRICAPSPSPAKKSVFSDTFYLAITINDAILSPDEHLLDDRQCGRPGLNGPLAAPKTSRRPTGGARPAPPQWTTPCACQNSSRRLCSFPLPQTGQRRAQTHQNPPKPSETDHFFIFSRPAYDQTRTAKDALKPTKTNQNQVKLSTFLFFQGRLMIKSQLSKNLLGTAPLPLDLRRRWPVSKY